MTFFRATPWAKYIATNSTETSQALVAGTTNVLTAAQAPVEMVNTAEGFFRGAEFKFYGTGANNSTVVAYIWQWTWEDGHSKRHLEYLGSATLTLSTKTGDGGLVATTEIYADTIVWARATTATTPLGCMDIIESTHGAGFLAQAYSPANNTIGRLFIPDFGVADGFLVEFDLGTATSANCLFRLTR